MNKALAHRPRWSSQSPAGATSKKPQPWETLVTPSMADNTITTGQQKRGRKIPAMLTMSRHDMKPGAARWHTPVYSASIGST